MSTLTGTCCLWGAGGADPGLLRDTLGKELCHSVLLSCFLPGTAPLDVPLCQAAVTAQSQSPDRGHCEIMLLSALLDLGLGDTSTQKRFFNI